MVRIAPDLSLLPGPGGFGGAAMGGPMIRIAGGPMIRIALIVLMVVIVLVLGHFISDVILDSQNPYKIEAIDPDSIVLFSSPRYGKVKSDALIHSGPGDLFHEVGRINRNSQLTVLGYQQSADGRWLIVQQYGNPVTGWIKSEHVEQSDE